MSIIAELPKLEFHFDSDVGDQIFRFKMKEIELDLVMYEHAMIIDAGLMEIEIKDYTFGDPNLQNIVTTDKIGTVCEKLQLTVGGRDAQPQAFAKVNVCIKQATHPDWNPDDHDAPNPDDDRRIETLVDIDLGDLFIH
jgi:hypothetical protein